MSSLQKFLGGSPLSVATKLVFVSLLVGAFMAFVGLSPLSLFRGLLNFIENVVNLGFDSVQEIGRWILYGAMIVVPIWLLTRVFARK